MTDCSGCIHAERFFTTTISQRCQSPEIKGGEKRCWYLRGEDGACGPDGKYFAPKPEQPRVKAERRGRTLTIIRDLEPYRAVAADVASGGKPPVISGRRQHREFLRRNGYAEVGNSVTQRQPESLPRSERIGDIRAALQRHGH